MRAGVVDTRLEAIVGPPVVRLRGRDNIGYGFTPGQTVVVAGLYVPTGSTQRLYTAATLYTHVSGDPGQEVAQFGRAGRAGHAFYGYARQDYYTHELTLYFGRATSGVASWNWEGTLAGALYGRTLTDAEALAVARHLAQTL